MGFLTSLSELTTGKQDSRATDSFTHAKPGICMSSTSFSRKSALSTWPSMLANSFTPGLTALATSGHSSIWLSTDLTRQRTNSTSICHPLPLGANRPRILSPERSTNLTSGSIRGTIPISWNRLFNSTILRPSKPYKTISTFCTIRISLRSQFSFSSLEFFIFDSLSFSAYSSFVCFNPQLFRFATQGPHFTLFISQVPFSIVSLFFKTDSVQNSAGITCNSSEISLFCVYPSTNIARFPEPQRPRSTQMIRSSHVGSANRYPPANSLSVHVRSSAIATSKTPTNETSPKRKASNNRCRSCMAHGDLSLLMCRTCCSLETRTQPTPVASQLVRLIHSLLLDA